jgi:hypothetical protein
MQYLIEFKDFVNEYLSDDRLEDLEKYADSLFRKLKVDVVFTRHFKERVNDLRNGKPITYEELENLFLKAYDQAGERISKLPTETEAVLKDISSNLNAPFKIKDPLGHPSFIKHDMIMKTIMRKERFMSSNPTIPV